MKFFPILLFGAIAFFMFKDEISLYAGKAKRIAEASSSVSDRGRGAELERLGGERTAADLRWISELNVLCARRNSQENALPGPADTTRSLARYAARTLQIWDRYARRAATLPVPESYATEASWVRLVADGSRRRGIEAVLIAARANDRAAAHRAIDSFSEVSGRMRPKLAQLGVSTCADFQP